jgi:pimeloyl-ACP methyl ester carboxylesterase
VRALYERGLAQLPFRAQSREVETRFGRTHLLCAGPDGAPPLVVVHGANGSAVAMAAGFGALAERLRCYFLDVPGEPNRSSEVRLSKADDSLVRWLDDVLGALAVERPALLGMSGGGFAVLKYATARAERVSRAVLVVPEGLARQRPGRFLTQVLWPLLRYRLRPSERNARRLAAQLSGQEPAQVSPALLEQMDAMRQVRSAANLGAPLDDAELARLRAPLLLVVAGRDVVFPARGSAERARALVPALRDVIELPHAGHVHPDLVGPPVLARIADFLSG